MTHPNPHDRWLDRAHLDAQTGGDAELAAELLALFGQQCRILLPGIADLSRPRGERADLAHTLKGSALGVGAGRVADCSARTEDFLRARPDGEPPLAELARAVEATLAEIAV